jgi:hypothetical protein
MDFLIRMIRSKSDISGITTKFWELNQRGMTTKLGLCIGAVLLSNNPRCIKRSCDYFIQALGNIF